MYVKTTHKVRGIAYTDEPTENYGLNTQLCRVKSHCFESWAEKWILDLKNDAA